VKREHFKSYLIYGVFGFYLILMAYILLFKNVSPMDLFSSARIYHRSVELIPFNQIYGYLSGSINVSPTVAIQNVAGNIVIFIPLGIYLALFRNDKRVYVNMLFVFLTSLSVEIIQFAFGLGASDIDDITLNCTGGLMGILIYRGFMLLLKNDEKVRSVVALSSVVIALPLLALIILLFTNS